MNIVTTATAVFLASVLSRGQFEPTTLKRELTFIVAQGSWWDLAYTCEVLFDGSLLTDDTNSTSAVLRYYNIEGVWPDNVWTGLFVADRSPNDYKWEDSCISHNLSVYDVFNTVPTQLDPFKRCVFKRNLTTWDFDYCSSDHSGICEHYTGPCTYLRDTNSLSCTKGIVWSAATETDSLQDCENYCSSIEPYTIGQGECWAVTFMPLSSQNHGTCYVSMGVNPFQFDSSQSAWYEDICTQTPIALRPTKVSWKRCFIKPVTYFGPIVYSNMTSNIGSICSNSTVTSTDYMTTDNGSAGGPETTGNELETTTYHITTVTTVTETPVQATTTAPTETTQPPGIETIPPAETTIQTTQTTIPQPVETTTLTPQTTMPTTETTTRVTEPTIPPQAESTTQTTQTTISPPTETTTRATGTTIPLAAKTKTSFIETTKRETTQSGTTTGLDTEHTTYLAQSIAECVCACTENENLTLIDKISNLKQDTMINKEATTAHSRARQSASDDRPTAQGLGVVMGVGLITVVVILVSLGDIITLSHLIIKNLIK